MQNLAHKKDQDQGSQLECEGRGGEYGEKKLKTPAGHSKNNTFILRAMGSHCHVSLRRTCSELCFKKFPLGVVGRMA